MQPSGGEGRSLLRRELLRPEYNDRALLNRFLEWLREQLTKGVDAASGSPPFATLAAMVLFVVLVAATPVAVVAGPDLLPGRAAVAARPSATNG